VSVPPVGGDLEQLYERAPFGYLITDADDVLVRVNQTMTEWGGFDAQQLLGRPFRDLLPSGSQLLYETRHLPMLRLQGFVHEVSLQMTKADGSLLPVLVNATSVLDADGAVIEVRIGVLDASNRTSYEKELLATQRTAKNLADRVSVLQDASAAFSGNSTETQIAHTLASILEGALVASSACVALVDASGRLEVVAGNNPLAGRILPDRQLLGTAVLESEKPVVVGVTERDAAAYPTVVSALREARLQTIAVFPIMSDATPIGVAAAFFGRERSLAESETAVVLAVARQASQVLTRSRAQEQLAYAAQHDQLTGLANRASLRDSITRALASASRQTRPISIMFIDLDGFKPVNDRLGHHVGDAILREVATRLTASVRATELVGRHGGDEFVVVCDDTGSDDAAAIADRIHEAIRRPFADAPGFEISASVGIASHEASDGPISTDDLIGAADAAMYESKRLGRDRSTRVHV
jgi:diguanylate cyclase (GGDEF)-like protein/PAS domain S-box-containing protein